MTELHVLPLGIVNVFVLKGTYNVLIDTGIKPDGKALVSALEKVGIHPDSIELIILTHSHEDHTAAVSSLIEQSSAKLCMHRIEYQTTTGEIEDGIQAVAPLMKLLFRLKDLRGAPRVNKPMLQPDILLEGEEFSLHSYGIEGKAVLTPGHTKGSLSILLDDGRAIIGDQLMAFLPWQAPGRPILAYDLQKVRGSLQRLIEMGAADFYLSHGRHYGREAIESALRRF